MALIKDKIYYTYSDITILPTIVSGIEHRDQCIPLDENGMLPLFTAPMDTVVNEKNFELFTNEMIYAILPRTVDISTRVNFSTKSRWAAYSLKEFEEIFCNEKNKLSEKNKIYTLIDVANGHMKKIFTLVRAAKNIYGDNIVIMVGNIANPETYRYYAEIGVDYVRCGIGGGQGCLSTSNLGIHMPMASLIDEVVKVKNNLLSLGYEGKPPKIIADGGIRNYSDIIKALALGADYVMVGSVFSRMLESAAEKKAYSAEWRELQNRTGVELCDLEEIHGTSGDWFGTINKESVFLGKVYATFYGMASREGQIALNGSKTKTSEGVKKSLSVDYTMHTWCENFSDYLRSAMSYVGSYTLDEFRNMAVTIVNSNNAVSAVNK